MTTSESIAVFSSFSPGEQAEFLAGLIHELTIVARDSYEAGGDTLTNPQRVRRVNEVQHRLSDFLWALLRNDSRRFPDGVLVKIILEQPEDHVLGQQLHKAFARLAAQRLTTA